MSRPSTEALREFQVETEGQQESRGVFLGGGGESERNSITEYWPRG